MGKSPNYCLPIVAHNLDRYCSAGKIEVALKKRPKEDFSWSKTHIDYLVAISMLGPSVSQCECGRGEERVGSVLLLPGSSAVNIPARTRA